MRGSRAQIHILSADPGSIPACAGEPISPSWRYRRRRVHPRVCGGAKFDPAYKDALEGPSPRVRGSRLQKLPQSVTIGSIPACAGEPISRLTISACFRVHPRVCGGALIAVSLRSGRKGPSPRVRGSHSCIAQSHYSFGSIPACAGEPGESGVTTAANGVHPRVCGGAALRDTFDNGGTGPSPRVRGSPL